MKRRGVLAAVGSVGIVATAGCTSVGSTTITNPEEERTDDNQINLNFRTESGESVATLTVQPGRQRYPGHGGGTVPVEVAITHGRATKIESVRLDLRAPPNGVDVPAEVAFTTSFAKPRPSIELYTDPDDVSTVLDIPETGEQGEGTMIFDFRLISLRDTTAKLAVNTTIEMTEGGTLGQDYTLEGLTLVPLPGKTE